MGAVLQVVEILNSAKRLIREYGDRAEEECDARAGYHQAQGDPDLAEQWRLIREMVKRLRQAGRP